MVTIDTADDYDYWYTILDVDHDATADAVSKHAKRLGLFLHPDKN